jgi:hypothetical protein
MTDAARGPASRAAVRWTFSLGENGATSQPCDRTFGGALRDIGHRLDIVENRVDACGSGCDLPLFDSSDQLRETAEHHEAGDDEDDDREHFENADGRKHSKQYVCRR